MMAQGVSVDAQLIIALVLFGVCMVLYRMAAGWMEWANGNKRRPRWLRRWHHLRRRIGWPSRAERFR